MATRRAACFRFILNAILIKITGLSRLNRNPETLANKGFYTGPTFEKRKTFSFFIKDQAEKNTNRPTS
jgi:hypothetical protein